jgi:hypothetical protein
MSYYGIRRKSDGRWYAFAGYSDPWRDGSPTLGIHLNDDKDSMVRIMDKIVAWEEPADNIELVTFELAEKKKETP